MVEPEAQDDADETPAADPGQAPVDSNDDHFDVEPECVKTLQINESLRSHSVNFPDPLESQYTIMTSPGT